MNKHYSDEKNVQIIIALLKEHSIKRIIASPGSTNMSLVTSFQNDSYFEMYSAVDERSAAYMACGMADESGEPVVITCTGATASRNYLPGLTEAFYRKLPILSITSTIPYSRVGHNHAQVIDRSVMPKDTAKLSVQLPIVKDDDDFSDCELKVNNAILELTRHGGGPVHLNLPTKYSKSFNVEKLPRVRKIQRFYPSNKLPDLPKGKIGIFIGAHKKISSSLKEAIEGFCSSNNAIVLCDHTSGYTGKNRILFSIAASQKILNPDLLPDLLIHIGEITGEYSILKLIPENVWRVSEDGELKDTFLKLKNIFEMSEQFFFENYTSEGKLSNEYYLEFANYINTLRSLVPEVPFSNIYAASILHNKIPENSIIHFGILNSLRSWNLFEVHESITTACNVGGFGIDGNLSSLLGASLCNFNKLNFLIIGDLAFFYDMNALGNRAVSKNIRILLVNNGKGTEFRNFGHSAACLEEKADEFIAAAGHFGNKSKILVKNYAESLGFIYLSASSKETFEENYPQFIDSNSKNKPILFEIFTESEDESNALEKMVEIKKSTSGQAKKIAKHVLGKKGINSIKQFIKR